MMSAEQLLEEKVEIDKADIPAETVEREPANDDGAPDETEARARAMGWIPQDEYKGDQSKWKDAKSFVAVLDENPKIVRERLNQALTKQTELERKLHNQGQTYQDQFKRLERMSTVALERQRKNIIEQYDAAKRQAVELGDTARYDQLETAKREAVTQFDTQADAAYEQPQPQQQTHTTLPPEQHSAVQSWQASNPWYGKDEAMTMLAQLESKRIANEHPGLTVQQNLAEVVRAVSRRFPEKFSTQQRPANGSTPTVESGSRTPSGAGRRGWGDMPADARAVGARQIKEGLFKDQADYAKEYWSQP